MLGKTDLLDRDAVAGVDIIVVVEYVQFLKLHIGEGHQRVVRGDGPVVDGGSGWGAGVWQRAGMGGGGGLQGPAGQQDGQGQERGAQPGQQAGGARTSRVCHSGASVCDCGSQNLLYNPLLMAVCLTEAILPDNRRIS